MWKEQFLFGIDYNCCFFLVASAFLLEHNNGTENKRNIILVEWISIGLTILYIIGLCIMYMFKINEIEAREFAQFSRYFVSPIISLLLISVAWLSESCQNSQKVEIIVCGLFLAVFGLSNQKSAAYSFFSKQNLKACYENRYPIDFYSNYIESRTEPQSRIVVVVQDTPTIIGGVCQLNMMPDRAIQTESLGPQTIKEEERSTADVVSNLITAEKWQEELKLNYDYVVLNKLNDVFTSGYSSVF